MTSLHINETIGRVITNNYLTILQFGSETCGPCHSITHKIDEWLHSHPSVVERYVPVEDFQTETAQHEVFGVPTTILYFEGKEILRKSGYYSLEEFFAKAEKILKLSESQE